MISKVPKRLVERHSDYRKYVRQITDSVPRGKFWTGFSGYFDATLGLQGYRSLQVPYLENIKVDLAVNIASFMEMDFTEVERYFALIDQHLEVGGYFFCSNREEKITVYEEYPWNEYGNYRDVFYESGRFKTSRKNPFLDRLRQKIAPKDFS